MQPYPPKSDFEFESRIAIKAIFRIVSAVLLSLLLPSGQAFADFTGQVVKVVDGDTVHVLVEGDQLRKVRLTGIDAPERGQPYGRKSTEYLSSLIASRWVYVASNRQDRYQRDLGKILLNDTDINLEMVAAGYAWWYRYYRDQQSVTDQALYEQAEDGAKDSGIALWADKNPINPYRWRKGDR